MKHPRQIPMGAKIVAVLYCIGAALSVIASLISLFFAFSGIAFASIFPPAILGSALLFVLSAILIGLAVLAVFVGRDLWKGRPWARIAAIAFSALFIFTNLPGIQSSPFVWAGIAINGAIVLYLLLSKDVNRAFA